MNTRDTHVLGSVEDLPADYRSALDAANLVALWPNLRDALPFEAPKSRTRPMRWPWASVRPLLVRAGELTPMEKAERRVLVLANPSRGLANMQASGGMFLGMQLVLPGEVAPNHRHTPNAVRIIVEGDGGYTVVEGVKCPMQHGDLILTPSGLWHEHHHEGRGPLIWLDVLDLPLVLQLDASYATPGTPQAIGAAGFSYDGGLAPVRFGERAAPGYPVLRYAWQRTAAALAALAGTTPRGEPTQIAFVNPETGADCMQTVAFSALMVRPGEEVRLTRISPARVLHVIDGGGDVEIDGESLTVERADTLCAPGIARVRIANRSARAPLFLMCADESPVFRKLGFYETRAW